jgi:Fe2+ transport system protein FeoA
VRCFAPVNKLKSVVFPAFGLHQKIGSLCKINHIDLSQSKKIKLLGLGIKAGLTVSILRNRGGDIVLALGNARVSVGRTMAHLIKVTIV